MAAPNGMRLTSGVQIPADASGLRISEGGEVSAVLAGSDERVALGSIVLVTFASLAGLESHGDNLLRATPDAGSPMSQVAGEEGAGLLRQGYLEMANVDMIDEMTGLVLAQRAYQLNARVLQASDQILETINNLRR